MPDTEKKYTSEEIKEIGKKAAEQILDFVIKKTETFITERAESWGNRLTLLSVLLIFVFTETLDVKEGDILGFKLAIKGGNAYIFFLVMIIACVYFSLVYIFELMHCTRQWKRNFSLEKEEVKKAVQVLQNVNNQKEQEFSNDLSTNTVDQLKQIKIIDEAITIHYDKSIKEIERKYYIRVFVQFIPPALGLAAIVLGIRYIFLQ